MRYAVVAGLVAAVLCSCKARRGEGEGSRALSGGFPNDLTVPSASTQYATLDEARVLAAMVWLKQTFSSVQDTTRNACLTNSQGDIWSDIQAHYYCLMDAPQRACFTGHLTVNRPPNYQAAYQHCVTGSGSFSGINYNQPLAGVDANQGDVFRYIMFTRQNTFCLESQRRVIDSYYSGLLEAVPDRNQNQPPDPAGTTCAGGSAPAPNPPTPNPPAPNPPPPAPPPPPPPTTTTFTCDVMCWRENTSLQLPTEPCPGFQSFTPQRYTGITGATSYDAKRNAVAQVCPTPCSPYQVTTTTSMVGTSCW